LERGIPDRPQDRRRQSLRLWAQICFCERLALILTFSPWEKEQMSPDSAFADARPASPAAGFSKGQPAILPLPRRWEGRGKRGLEKEIGQ
jgi:hypothetical protein